MNVAPSTSFVITRVGNSVDSGSNQRNVQNKKRILKRKDLIVRRKKFMALYYVIEICTIFGDWARCAFGLLTATSSCRVFAFVLTALITSNSSAEFAQSIPTQVMISRGIEIWAVNERATAVRDYERGGERVFVPAGKLMLVGGRASLRKLPDNLSLALTEDGVWGLFVIENAVQSQSIYTEQWIRGFNTSRTGSKCGFFIWNCESEKCSADESYAPIVVTLVKSEALKTSGSETAPVIVKAGSGFRFVSRQNGSVIASSRNPKKAECDPFNVSPKSQFQFPEENVVIIEIDTNLKSIDRGTYINSRRRDFIRRSYIELPSQFELRSRCGDLTTLALTDRQRELAKTSVSAGFKLLEKVGSDFSFEWETELFEESSRSIQKPDSRETIEKIYVSGDGDLVVSLVKVAECEERSGQFLPLGSNAKWFYQFRPEYEDHTFAFDCRLAVEKLGLLFDHESGKIHLEDFDDLKVFHTYLKDNGIGISASLLIKEITKWRGKDASRHCD